jgi:deazaflavin-dependent oxidoreductase (nitroreductase family)
MKALAIGIAALAITTSVVGTAFFVGMRRSTPIVIDGVRRFNRITNRIVLRSAGQPGASASRICHVGRRSGRSYETPIKAVPVDGGFVVALPHGMRADWVRNVLAVGQATLIDEGTSYRLDQPLVRPTAELARLLPAKELRTLRRFRVDQCLTVAADITGDRGGAGTGRGRGSAPGPGSPLRGTTASRPGPR